MNTNGHKLIRGHPREWFVHPEVNITVNALEKLNIKPSAAWKYRCPWNDNGGEEIYPISYPKLFQLMEDEKERTEKERNAHKKDHRKMIFFSSFYVYTRADGPGSPLKFAFHFSREKYRENRAKEIKRLRSGQYEKPFLVYSHKCSAYHFDEEAYLQKIREMNTEISKLSKVTPSEKAKKQWKKVVHQESPNTGANKPTLVYSKPKTPNYSFEKDLEKTILKNVAESEKRKWKPPPQGYQVGVSDPNSKKYFIKLFQESGYNDLSLKLSEAEHVQIDIPSSFVLEAFEVARYSYPTLRFNIYKKNRDGYPIARYCFPKETTVETSKEAELITLRNV